VLIGEADLDRVLRRSRPAAEDGDGGDPAPR